MSVPNRMAQPWAPPGTGTFHLFAFGLARRLGQSKIFVTFALKHSDNSILRRQEVGRGFRLSVKQKGDGDRMDTLFGHARPAAPFFLQLTAKKEFHEKEGEPKLPFLTLAGFPVAALHRAALATVCFSCSITAAISLGYLAEIAPQRHPQVHICAVLLSVRCRHLDRVDLRAAQIVAQAVKRKAVHHNDANDSIHSCSPLC